jgi:hypothetical protein
MSSSGPPTPRSVHSDIGRRTRSGRSAARTDSPHGSIRKSTPPRAKKQKANKEKTKTPKLTAPLSVLTKEMANVPVRDMEAWVNRSVAERMKEVEKRNGYITRPMNSFMLYRSAYAERTKAWCVHNNHQVVSSVSGESWPLEPPEVREFYNELARIERINHQNAHPDYKFSPSKPGPTTRKRKGTESDDESEPSDLDDPDADWGSSNPTRSKTRSAKRPGRDAGYPARANLHVGIHGGYDDNFGPGDAYNKSSWEASNHGRPLPTHMGQNLYGQQYYQASIHHNPHIMGGVEDVRYAPIETPGYDSNPVLIGLPGSSHHDLLGMHSGIQTQMMQPQVDPMLLAFDDQHHSTGINMQDGLTLTQHAEYNPTFNSEFSVYTTAAPGPLITDYETKQWEPESTSPTFEQPGEFEKMWDEHNVQVMERRQSARSQASAKSNAQKSEMREPKSPKTT